MSKPRQQPRWVIAFLRALERTGEVRVAAADAGIDHSTAYARRKAHAEFAEGWDEALRAREVRLEEEERAAVEDVQLSVRPPLPVHASRESPSPAEGRGAELAEGRADELVGAGRQMKRPGAGRWSLAKEAIFFEELAATANVKRAAQAAGISTNAVYARRMKQALFRTKWAAVLDSGRASIEMKLVEAANRSFDPDELDMGEIEPRVSVSEAIRIVQIHGSKAQRGWVEEQPPDEDIEAVRERLFNKLERLRKRETARCVELGWTLDERYDHLVPPGWVQGPDYGPREPEEPAD